MKRLILSLLAALGLIVGLQQIAHASFDGARVYWPLPKNTNIFAVHLIDGTANAAWTNWNRIEPNIGVNTGLAMLTYTRVQPIFGRSVFWQAALPAATIDIDAPPGSGDTFTNGLGDPSLGATFNLYGAPGMMAKEWLRHDVGTVLNLGVNVTAPLGQYDPDSPVNIGSNQWKFRLSAPFIQSLRTWVPGKRFTLELMPTALFLTDNDDVQGAESSQKPVFGGEAHLTHDLTRDSFVSLDYSLMLGGDETITDPQSGVTLAETDGIDAHVIGATVGFKVNYHMTLFATHMQTIAEDDSDVHLEGSLTKLTLSWAWHSVLEDVYQFRNE